MSALLAVCGMAASASAAPPRLRLLVRPPNRLDTDGARYAAYPSRAGGVEVIDTRFGKTRRVRTPSDCLVFSAWSGRFLLNCGGTFTAYVMYARDGHLVKVPGAPDNFPSSPDSFTDIGRDWLSGEGPDGVAEYLNWHTGEIRSFGERLELDPVMPRDLDAPDLRSLPQAVGHNVFLRAGGTTVMQGKADFTPLRMKRSGRPSRTIDPCANLCEDVTLGGGWVTWMNRRDVKAYRLSDGKTIVWRFPGTSGPGNVRHTANRIFFTFERGLMAPPHYRVETADLPTGAQRPSFSQSQNSAARSAARSRRVDPPTRTKTASTSTSTAMTISTTAGADISP